MSFLQIFRIAIRALLRNKMRSMLTMLGVIIGVGAVIAMVAVGEGAKANVEATFASMGTNLLVLMPGSSQAGGVKGGAGTQMTLTWDDLTAIQQNVSNIRALAPQLRSNAQVLAESGNWATSIYGSTPDYFVVRSWAVSEGTTFTQADVDARAKVIVLGRTVADKLFGEGSHPTGQVLRVRNVPFTVMGVLEKKGQTSFGQDQDDCAVIPQKTFEATIQGGLKKFVSGTIYISATTSDMTTKVQNDVDSLLRERHKLDDDAPDDFQIRNLAEAADAQAESMKTLTYLLASVAAVSLLVGGIGIMNIMLVSVTERTREIGLRMALGAKRRHILAQFLAESLALSSIGGGIGIGLGIIASAELAAKFGWTTLVRTDVVVVAVVFSAMVGAVFGLYPARKASQLDPIDALRFE